MIAFTILGLLVFWWVCFWIGYGLVPAVQLTCAAWAVWLIGREAEHLMAVFLATHQAPAPSQGQQENGNG